MRLALTAAISPRGVIGRGNSMPWHIPAEQRHFRQLTEGHTVIMGDTTFRSIGQPLVNRYNIVISADSADIAGCTVCSSFDGALAHAQEIGHEAFVIGGASVYRQALPHVDTMYLSLIKHDYPGDVYFPTFTAQKWERAREEDMGEFVLVEMRRKLPSPKVGMPAELEGEGSGMRYERIAPRP